jgi:hypothetical protein
VRGDGSTTAQHWQKLLKAPSKVLQATAQRELTAPSIPPAGEHFVLLFFDLSCNRRQGMNGFEPLSWLEVEAYLRLTHQDIEPWEVRLLKRMDKAWLTAANEQESTE